MAKQPNAGRGLRSQAQIGLWDIDEAVRELEWKRSGGACG